MGIEGASKSAAPGTQVTVVDKRLPMLQTAVPEIFAVGDASMDQGGRVGCQEQIRTLDTFGL
jgi:pyruvate/2-oxoglutarate dehydrogenase complex dihydrolipoamide dehydrogenase (E3) component